ncbi:agarase [Paraglaciecola hydrolytica]|uniref:Agarase n=1 Tax=Paraglaciecola hydrolytica TaxID=1799789 RepID=A0A136A0Q8_9ALTE|nr:agarase [Paraglaciecola hydrolytica]KXI28812.1 agarase [Paraglaciecola hydrolytica]
MTFNKMFKKSAIALLLSLGACSADKQANLANTPLAKDDNVLQLLENFDGEQPALAFSLNGVESQIKTHVGSTNNALALSFNPQEQQAKISFKPAQAWDWSSYKEINFAFDASNPGTESIQLYISIANEAGEVSHQSINIAAGEQGTYYLLLDGEALDTDMGFKKSGMPAWQSTDEMAFFRYGSPKIDLHKVSEIGLYIKGNLSEKSLELDNLRLRANPSYDISYRQAYVDRFGQNDKMEFPIKIHSEAELKQEADKELAQLNQSGLMPDRSRFGGWKDGPRSKATGYFRTEKVNGKWWMVDPDGYLFFSHGLANVRMANLTTLTGVDFKDDSVRYIDPEAVTPEDSMGIVQVSDEVRKSRYIASDVRHDMFTWLPDYKDELAEHYSYRRSVLFGPVSSGETYSFYRANLERRYGQQAPESYVKKWEEVTLARFQDWGFTSMGNWVDPAFYTNEKVPYFANGWIIGDYKTLASKHDVWAPMPDAFDPEFVRRAQITIDTIANEVHNSPWCVGVFVDNEKSWGLREGSVEHRYGLILDAMAKNAQQSPAKAAFTKQLQSKYQTIAALNQAWQTQFASWQTLANGVSLSDFPQAMISDLSHMLEMLSEQYFKVVHDALAKAMPQHLYMGARMANWGMPEETIKASVKYSDVLSFNIYEEGIQPKAWAFLQDIDLPTVIGEYHIGASRETGLYHPGLVQADGQADRAQMYLDYMQSVLASPNMVGAHWFQYVDSPISGRAFDGENYNVGFVSTTDIPYPEMVEAAKKFNATVYPRRYNDNK